MPYLFCILTVGPTAGAAASIGRDLCQSFLRLNCFPASFTPSLCLCDDHIQRISCYLAGFWAAASPTLAAIRSLITCLLCVSLCTSFGVESVYLRSLHPIFRPLCVYERSVSCSCRPGSPLHVNLLHARCWLAARPPNLFPVSSSHFFSLPVYRERERSLMSGWRSEGLFYCSPACSLSSWLPLLQPI